MNPAKSKLRKQALNERLALTEEKYEELNLSLIQQVRDLISQKDFQVIHTFLPIVENKEPNVTSLFNEWWNSKRKIMVSKTDFKSKEMSHYWLTKETKLEKNSWGIPEPVNGSPAKFNEATLVIVPMLLGDKQGNRIGYGGGYYDRLLVEHQGYAAGLSFSPLVDKLPTEAWDIPLNAILTSH